MEVTIRLANTDQLIGFANYTSCQIEYLVPASD